MRSIADLVTGPLYSYLGHFRQRRFLEAGHNDIGGLPENPYDSATQQDKYLTQLGQGESPTASPLVSSSGGNPLG